VIIGTSFDPASSAGVGKHCKHTAAPTGHIYDRAKILTVAIYMYIKIASALNRKNEIATVIQKKPENASTPVTVNVSDPH
jgi:hypothetical protein